MPGTPSSATRVADDGVPGNGVPADQDYALVVSNVEERNVPILRVSSTMIEPAAPGGEGFEHAVTDDEAVVDGTHTAGGIVEEVAIDPDARQIRHGSSVSEAAPKDGP